MTSALRWFKSSYSGNDDSACVEVAISHPSIHVRDSKDPRRTPLTFGARAWSDFVGLGMPRRW